MDRITLQDTAVKLLTDKKRLLCRWATGVGKSAVALKFISANPGMKCLILVPEQNNIQNWEYEFCKFNVPNDNVCISCYASFHKYKNTEWNFIVFDEIPHVDTELKRKICKSVKGNYILALGAVVEDELDVLENTYGKFWVSTVRLRDAINWGIIPKPTICIIHLTMDNTNKLYYVEGKKCSAWEKYQRIKNKTDAARLAFDRNPTRANKQIMLAYGNERKRFLGKLKDDAVALLAKKLSEKHKRFLCFCSSIKQAQLLGGDRAFTSKTSKSERILDKFNNHEIDSLFVVSKLIEGQNLVDIERGIITQVGGSRRITVQMIGRILRSENPIVYIPIFDGTKDISFIQTVTSEIPEDCIKHYNYKSIL